MPIILFLAGTSSERGSGYHGVWLYHSKARLYTDPEPCLSVELRSA